MNVRFLLALALIAIQFSCKRHKAGKNGSSNLGADSAVKSDPTVLKMNPGIWSSPWWTAKAKVGISSPKLNVNFNLVLRAEKDQKIWFSATAFGLLEVARGLATPDSLLIWDKFNNRCYKGKLNTMGNYLPMSLRLDQLQHFLLGRVFWDHLAASESWQRSDTTLLKGTYENIQYRASVWKDSYLASVNASTSEKELVLNLRNNQFKQQQDQWFPMSRLLIGEEKKPAGIEKSALSMEFTKFEFLIQSPDFQLNIPADCVPVPLTLEP